MIDIGPWVALAVAVGALGLFAEHAVDAGRAYRHYHDDRAALDGLVAMTLTTSALGLVVAAAAPFIDAAGMVQLDYVRNLGFGIVAGALLATSATMFAIDRMFAS